MFKIQFSGTVACDECFAWVYFKLTIILIMSWIMSYVSDVKKIPFDIQI